MSDIQDAIKIIVALDFDRADAALNVAKQLNPALCHVKIGKELFTRCGPSIVEQVQSLGYEVFLDMKYHDIPHTVAQAVAAAADMGVWMVNVHATGGREMMVAAREALDKSNSRKPYLIAVTALTSMDTQDLLEVGINSTPHQLVERLASLSQECGLDGVVCSSQEVELLRAMLGEDFKLVTPGIRPQGSQQDDQKRVMTPGQAVAAGSDYLVIGRPITKSPDPQQALVNIMSEIKPV